jgi:hypothetical protein
MFYPGPAPLSLRPLLRSLALSTSSLFSAPVFRKRNSTFVHCLIQLSLTRRGHA